MELPFQFTLPRGERQAVRAAGNEAATFQFTLPRGERLRRQENEGG